MISYRAAEKDTTAATRGSHMPGGLFGKVRSQVVLTCLNSVFRKLWSIEPAVNCHHDLTSWLVGHDIWRHDRNVFKKKKKKKRKTER